MRSVLISLLCCVVCLAGCLDHDSAGDKVKSFTGQPQGTPATVTSIDLSLAGEPTLARQWEYQLPVEAAIFDNFDLNSRETGEVAVGPDGTVYFLAWAMPSAKDLFEERDRYDNKILEQGELPPGERSFRVNQLLHAQNIHAPKECWLHALNPDGTLRWVYKAPGEPVNRPYIASDGNIVFGSYSAQSVAFDPDNPQQGDPLENVGGLYVVSPAGKLVREINPGGWIDEVQMAANDTIICLVNDRGSCMWFSTYGRADGLPENRGMVNHYVALNLKGKVLWMIGAKYAKTGPKFKLLEADHGGAVLGVISTMYTTLDIGTGEVIEQGRYNVRNPRQAVRSLDGSIFEATVSSDPWDGLRDGSMTCDDANTTGLLTMYGADGGMVGMLPIGCGFSAIAAGSDGGAAVLRSRVYESADIPGENIYENYVTYVDDMCRPVWDYEDQRFNPFDSVKVDAAGNVYLTACTSAAERLSGIISVDPAGELRWVCPFTPLIHGWDWSLGPGDQVFIPTQDTLVAFAPEG